MEEEDKLLGEGSDVTGELDETLALVGLCDQDQASA